MAADLVDPGPSWHDLRFILDAVPQAVFWKDRFYVRIGAPTDDDMSDVVLRAAREAATWIEDDEEGLREFSAFPTDGLVDGSLVYMKSSALGLAHLSETFLADYQSDGGAYRMFFCDMATAEEGAATLEAQEEFLRSGGTVYEYGEGGLVWGREKYLGAQLTIARGNVVAGCVGLDDRAMAEAKVRDLLLRAAKVVGRGGETGNGAE